MRILASVFIALCSLAFLGVPLSWGEDPTAELDRHGKAVNRAARTPAGEQRVVEHLSKELGVPAETLRAQREQSKLGWGELLIAHRLSQKTGVPVEDLIAEHKAGKGWGKIAQEHDAKLGEIVGEVKKSSRALEATAEKGHKARPGEKKKADHPGRPGPKAGGEGGKGPGPKDGGGHPGGGPGKGPGK